MRLTNKAIELIDKKTEIKTLLALELSKSVYTIQKHLKENEDDNDLTKISALNIISEHTGLTQDEILTDKKAAA